MSHFQVSQDLDEPFSSLSRLGWVIFKSLQDLDEVWHPFLVFWIRKDSGNLRKALDWKGPGRLLAGNTPRLGAKRQIGSSGISGNATSQFGIRSIKVRHSNLDCIHVCSACVAPCADPEGQLVLTLTRRSSLSRLGWVIFKSSRLGWVIFKTLETWMSHFQVSQDWMRHFQVSRDLDASFSRSARPDPWDLLVTLRPPASMLLWFVVKIRHLLSKKTEMARADSHSCQGRQRKCRLRIFCVSIGPVQTVRHTHKITQTNMPGSRCPSVYGILIYICVQLSVYVRGGAPSDQNFCILFIYLITQKKWGHSRQP